MDLDPSARRESAGLHEVGQGRAGTELPFGQPRLGAGLRFLIGINTSGYQNERQGKKYSITRIKKQQEEGEIREFEEYDSRLTFNPFSQSGNKASYAGGSSGKLLRKILNVDIWRIMFDS
jgi:hypothetical protein